MQEPVSNLVERLVLRLRPRPSPILAAFVSATHGAALAFVFALPLDWVWRIGLGILVLLGSVHAIWAQVLFKAPWAVREAAWHSDGTWILTLASGKRHPARLLPSTLVTTRLLVLHFRSGRWRYCTMVLLQDSLDTDLLRRLRVRLRLFGIAHSTDTDGY